MNGDAGASARDTLDGKLKVTTSSNVDTRKVGKYTVTYSAADVGTHYYICSVASHCSSGNQKKTRPGLPS